MWLTPRDILSSIPPVSLCHIRSFYIKPCECNYGDNLGKFYPSNPAFQGRWNQHVSVSHLWLPTWGSMVTMARWPIFYHLRDNQYLQNFLPMNLTPLRWGFPLEFCNGAGAHNTRMMTILGHQNMGRYVLSFKHNASIGETGRWICHNNITLCMHSMLTR